MEKRLYTVREAAAYLGRTDWALRSMIAARKIPFVQEGGGCKIMFDKKALDKYIERNTISAELR